MLAYVANGTAQEFCELRLPSSEMIDFNVKTHPA